MFAAIKNCLETRLGGPLFVAVILMASALSCLIWAQDEANRNLHFPTEMSQASEEDLPAFYRAGDMAREGRAAAAYTPAAFQEEFNPPNQNLLFLNPPHFFLAAWVLAGGTYAQAKIAILLLTAAAMMGMIHLVRLRLGAFPYVLLFLSPGFFFTLMYLQISVIFFLFITFALVCGKDRPILSGIALALATMKPQFGLLIPLFLLGRDYWRTVAYASALTICLVVLSVLCFGLEVWSAFIESVRHGAHAEHAREIYDVSQTFNTTLGRLGADPAIRFLAQFTALCLGGAVIWSASRQCTKEAAIGITLMVTSWAAPSFMFYDMMLREFGILFLLRARPIWPISWQVIFGFIWLSPMIALVASNTNRPLFLVIDNSAPFLALVGTLMAFGHFADMGRRLHGWRSTVEQTAYGSNSVSQ